jgi:hypothetical protein
MPRSPWMPRGDPVGMGREVRDGARLLPEIEALPLLTKIGI